jgi:hypothetical protein
VKGGFHARREFCREFFKIDRDQAIHIQLYATAAEASGKFPVLRGREFGAPPLGIFQRRQGVFHISRESFTLYSTFSK